MDKKVKKIGIRYILAWIVGVLFIVAGASYLTKSILGGLLWLIAGIIIIPPFSNFIEKKYNIHLSGWLLFIIFLVLIGIGTSQLPSSKEKTSTPTSPQVTVEKPTETQTSSEKVVETPKTEEKVVVKEVEQIERAKLQLEIVSSHDYIEYDYLFIVGEVENKGELKFGLSQGTLNIWMVQDPDSWALDCQVDGKVTQEGASKPLLSNIDEDWLIGCFDLDNDDDGMPDSEDYMTDDSDLPGSSGYGTPDWFKKK